jgi:hypothetical protein
MIIGFYIARKRYGKKSQFSPEVLLARRLGWLPKCRSLEDIDIGVRPGSIEALEYCGMESRQPRDVRARVGVPNPDSVYRTEKRRESRRAYEQADAVASELLLHRDSKDQHATEECAAYRRKS